MSYNLTLSFALVFLTVTSTALADAGSFRSSLSPSGSDIDARASLSASFSERQSSLIVTASRLDPSQTCQLLVDGHVRGSGLTSRTGTLSLRFRSPVARGFQNLDFEPRGKSIELRINGNPILGGVLAGPGESPQSTASESADLTRILPNSRASASARFSLTSSGVSVFTVILNRAPIAPTTLLVNGQPFGSPLTPTNSGHLTFRFRGPTAPPGFAPLPSDPRGATLDLIQNGTPIFTGEMRTRARGINFSPRSTTLLRIPSTQSPAVGYAEAKWSVDQRARRDLEIEVEDVPLGLYDIFVNDILRGSFTVSNTSDGPEGEIEFSSHDDDDLPLSFDPIRAIVTIRDRSGLTWFSGIFDPSILATRPPAEPASTFTERLTSTRVDPDAKGEALYKVDREGAHYFEVEIEDVNPGAYSLRIGGLHRATLRASLIEDTVEGEVEFRSPGERGKVTLNFDPRGQLIEIIAPDGSILFSHLFGSGSAPTIPSITPFTIRQSLIAQPGTSGSIVAIFEVEKDGDSELELEARDIPVGTYQVSVGGIPRGTLTVVNLGARTRGEIEFDSDPVSPEILLNFPVLDQPISVSNASGLLFTRTLTRP